MEIDLKRYLRDVPDFPKPGILFKDITPLLGAPEAFGAAVERLAEAARRRGAEAVIGIESRGFIFGAPVARELGIPFVPVRKPGKLPAERMSIEYSLEYGASQLDIHKDALRPGQRAVIIDDLLATGGTAEAAAVLTERISGQVAGFLFVVELTGLGGRGRLTSYPVESLVAFP